MHIKPLEVMPGTLWKLTSEYCSQPHFLNQWVFPEIYLTGAVFTKKVSVTTVSEIDYTVQSIRTFQETLNKTVKVSGELQQKTKGKQILVESTGMVVTRGEDDRTLQVWRDEGDKEFVKITFPSDRPGVSRVLILDATALAVITYGPGPAFYVPLNGIQLAKGATITLPGLKTAYYCQMHASETTLSFISREHEVSTVFQYPIKGPFDRPQLTVTCHNVDHFQKEANRLFYFDVSQEGRQYQMLDVSTNKKTKLFFSYDRSWERVHLQGNILVRQEAGAHIEIWNCETGTLLRTIEKNPGDYLFRLLGFVGSSIYHTSFSTYDRAKIEQVTFMDT